MFSGFADEETRSLGDGTFLLGGLAAGAYDLRARARGFTEARGEAAAGGDPVELRLGAAGGLTGVVVEEGDRPVEGYHVQAQPMGGDEGTRWEQERTKVVSAPDGRFLLEDMGVGGYVVRVIVPERAPATVSGVKVMEGQTTDVGTVRALRGGVVRGQVADAAGGPVAGARVTVSTGAMDIVTWWGLSSDQSDAQGAFEVRGVPAGMAQVSAVHPDYAHGQTTVEVDPAQGPAEARVVLRTGGRIEGSAWRRDGQPLAGQTVMIAAEGGAADAAPPQTGADGTFVAEHVPAGRATLSLMSSTGPGRFVNTITRQIEVVDGQTTMVELVSRDVLLSGRITRNRTPAAGVELAFQSQGGYSWVMGVGGAAGGSAASPDGPRRNAATTREDGSFEAILSEPGRHQVSAHTMSPRVSFPSRNVDIPDAESFALDLDFTVVPVSGTVIAKDTLEPVERSNVSARPRGSDGFVGTSAGRDGRFELLAAPGEYTLGAVAPGYMNADLPLSVGESGVSDLKLEMERGLEITGRVVNTAGQGVAGVQLMATGPGKLHERSQGYTQSRGDGSFTIGSLKDVAHNLAAGSELLGFAIRAGVKAGTRDLSLTLRPGGRLRVRFLDQEGTPLKDVYPQVKRVDGAQVAVPVFAGQPSDASGTSEVVVPAGLLEVQGMTDKAMGQATVEVESGQTAEVEIRLTEPPGGP
jgi:hypothetical protein